MKKSNLTLGSLFSGSGGFPLGGLLCGITPFWASEIEPFPICVTTKRLPFVKHYGDVSKLNGAELPPVDIITFGSPCQDMSIAGKRSGLDGERSGLFYQAIRIVKEMRCATNGEYPRYIVWENVPSAFSSNGGEDFKAVLETVCSVKGEVSVSQPENGKWSGAGEIVGNSFSLAWRTLDAQFWGVPQRRKRIFLVADFDGECAGKILFESEGLSGYSAESFRAWQRTAGAFEDSVGMSGAICLNDQGGNRMDVTDNTVCTLRSEAHHPPCVLESAGFCTENSAKAHSGGFEVEKSPTLRAGTVPAAVYENHSQDTRYTELSDTAPTVSATYGMGGNNQPFVVENTKCYDVRFTSEGTKNARQNVYETETARTIDTGGNSPDSNQGGVAVVTEPKAYGICSKDSNSMKSNNPHSGFYSAETSRTLDENCGNPSCNQGGIAVVSVQGSMIGRTDKNGPQGSGINEDVSFTLNATDRHAVAFSQDAYNKYTESGKCCALRACGGMYGGSETLVYSTSKNSYHTEAEENLANTLVATDYKDPPVVNDISENRYIVRRLTPTECARLQGFPDWWCADLEIDEPTEEDMIFWREVFETHRKITGTSTKPKSESQIKKWLKNPHTDSAEYKMWGNGVALPCVCFVLAGIVWANLFVIGIIALCALCRMWENRLLLCAFRVNIRLKGRCNTMKINYNVTGTDRKALVKAIGEILEVKPKYLGMPTAAYQIDYFTVSKDGVLEFDDRADSEEIENLLETLAERGFTAENAELADEEPTTIESPAQGETVGLTIEMPLDCVKLGNLTALLEAKGTLIKKALGIEELPVEVKEDRVSFPWFSEITDSDTARALTHFISSLCEMTVIQKRVTVTEKPVEKFRREYPVETRVELLSMDDCQAPPIGTKGTVRGVDDA